MTDLATPDPVAIVPEPEVVHDPARGITLPAEQYLALLMNSPFVSNVVRTLTDLGVFDAMTDGPASADDLAARLDLDAAGLNRLLRMVEGYGVVDRAGPGTYALNAASARLAADHPASHAGFMAWTDVVMPKAHAELGAQLRTGRVAFEEAFGADFYQHHAAHPDLDARWNAMMRTRAGVIGRTLADLVDWAGVETVVDVGGNQGDLLSQLLLGVPEVKGVLFDQPHVVADAEARLKEAEVADRVEVIGGDFFLEVPATGGLYLLANVLWNWDDERAAAILSTTRAAMTEGQRLVVLEPVVPDEAGHHPAKLLDVINMMLFGGQGRTLAEFDALLSAAGFERTAVRSGEQFQWSAIEARAC